VKTTLHSHGSALAVEYGQRDDGYTVTVSEKTFHAHILAAQDGAFTIQVNGQLLHVHIASDGLRTLVAIDGCVYEFIREEKKIAQSRQREAGRLNPEIRSPMPGKILEVRVSEGETVETGRILVVLEAMKMENALTAEGPARVRKLHVSSGELVDLGQLLVELEFPQAATQTESP
jgi:glutaconyl-CoA/methylmalonyl-CoA decarboxylase subunit gamma